MKVKLKTKEQLLKMGWKENTRSIYFRLSIDGIKSEPTWHGERNKIGTLTASQVDNCLGQSGVVHSLRISNDGSLQLIDVVVMDCGSKYMIALPVAAVTGFNQKEWARQHELWEFEINKKIWKYKPSQKIFTTYYPGIADMKKAIAKVEKRINFNKSKSIKK